jgi:PadR family transcriptional regulator, regulatory protein PadR
MAKSRKDATQEAVRRASQIADPREAARDAGKPAGPAEPFSGGLRREVLPLLVLHYIQGEPSYGNQLMERIAQVTAGVLSVNPNTMYPLLRTLESRGLIEGKWEHPERRSRRYYSITAAGREEYERMRVEVRPFLDSLSRSIEEIAAEVFG